MIAVGILPKKLRLVVGSGLAAASSPGVVGGRVPLSLRAEGGAFVVALCASELMLVRLRGAVEVMVSALLALQMSEAPTTHTLHVRRDDA